MFGTVSHDLHRFRRGLLSNYFSRRSVNALEPQIRSLVNRMCVKIAECQKTGQPVDLSAAYGSLTMDVISEYSFGNSYHCIESDNFATGIHFSAALNGVTESSHFIKHLGGWVLTTMRLLPEGVVKKLNPAMGLLIGFQKVHLDCFGTRHNVTNILQGHARSSHSCAKQCQCQ
jgi:hypothetical protein